MLIAEKKLTDILSGFEQRLKDLENPLTEEELGYVPPRDIVITIPKEEIKEIRNQTMVEGIHCQCMEDVYDVLLTQLEEHGIIIQTGDGSNGA